LDHPLDPAAWLLTLASALGYRVVAIDRPGYGASHGLVRDSVRADRQTEIVLDLIDMLRADSDTGAAVFLIGHSMGAVLAPHMAASAHAAAIAGLDISGLPFVFDEALADKQQLASLDFLPDNNQEFRRALFYGPVSTTVLAPKITVPVRITGRSPTCRREAGARDSRAAAPCSRHRRESSSPGSGPAATTSACTTWAPLSIATCSTGSNRCWTDFASRESACIDLGGCSPA
jgi:pimeloyl-ACP methyl ester carboxylesterase